MIDLVSYFFDQISLGLGLFSTIYLIEKVMLEFNLGFSWKNMLMNLMFNFICCILMLKMYKN